MLNATNGTTSQTVTVNDAASATVDGTVDRGRRRDLRGRGELADDDVYRGDVRNGQQRRRSVRRSRRPEPRARAAPPTRSASTVTFYGAGITGIGQSSGSWVVLGTLGFNSATGTYNYTTTGNTGSGTFSLTDSLYTYTVTGKLTATGLARHDRAQHGSDRDRDRRQGR